MSYIGNTSTTQAFTPAVDFFSGNGSTTAFTLSRPVASVAQVQVTIDNVAQNPSSAYTVSANTITFTSAPLSGTNNIYVYYTSPITQVIAPGQGTVGTTALVDASVTTAKLASTTGSGAVVLATSPTLVTPVLGAASATSITVAGSSSLGTASASGNTQIFQAPGSLFLTLNTNGTLSGARRNWAVSPEYDVAGALSFTCGASEGASPSSTKMIINSSGVAMFGTTSTAPAGSGDTKGISLFTDGSTSQIFVTGNSDTAGVFNRAGSDGALIRTRRQGSDVGSISVTASATAYNTSSDYRLKDNVQPMTGALAKVALLKPVTYKWKVDGSDGEGFIAHELAQVKPDCVSGDKDATRQEEYEVTPAVKDEEGNITTPAVMGTRTVPSYQGVDTSFLVATLTAAIQELKALNDQQAETINALTARIEALENR